MTKFKGIRKRWMANSISAVLLIVLLAVTAFSVAMASYYYNYIHNGLESRASMTARAYGDFKTENDYYQSAKQYAERMRTDDDVSDRIELQFIDSNGAVRFSTSGLTPSFSQPGTSDIAQVFQADPPEQGEFVGADPNTGERIMAISYPLTVDGRTVAAIRVVTSLRLVDRQIILVVGLTMLIGVAILAMVYFSNLYFVRSIVEPVADITETAKRIAAGSYGIQIEKKFDDEVGDLTDAINDMSLAIRQSEKLKNEFISSVSHELRTPLTAIRGWGETLMGGGADLDQDTLRKGMHVIMDETERLSSMVEELLDFSRMQSGRMKLVKSKMDVLAELSEAVIMYTERAKREGMLLIYDEPDLFVPVFGDRGKLRQVFINVIDNALKYSDPGDTTTVSARVEGNNIIIEVEDTGCGISAADLPKIKTKFYKANLTRRGSGIGLAVADEIIQMHGGRLDVSSVEGEGTTVTITLPIMERGDDSTQIAEATAEKAAPPSDAAVHLNKLDLSDIEDT